jgi:hypothetical protein
MHAFVFNIAVKAGSIFREQMIALISDLFITYVIPSASQDPCKPTVRYELKQQAKSQMSHSGRLSQHIPMIGLGEALVSTG